MALLPQKLSGPQEGTGSLLPAHHRAPLVVDSGQIPIGVDILCIKITEQGLRSRTDAHPLLQRLQAAVGHPGHLRGKAFHMILLLLEQTLRDKNGHVYVLNSGRLKPAVQLCLDILPDRVAVRLDHHASLYARVIAELCFFYHIRVPLGEIHVHGCDGFYQFLVLCHDCSPFLSFPESIKNVRLAHTRAGARLPQQPYSSARSAPPRGAFCFLEINFPRNKKHPVPCHLHDDEGPDDHIIRRYHPD